MEYILNLMNIVFGHLYPKCFIGYIPKDKYMHFISCFIGSALLTPLLYRFNPSILSCVISAIIFSIIAALKEVFDKLNKQNHTPDIWDWVASSLGGLTASLLFYEIYHLWY